MKSTSAERLLRQERALVAVEWARHAIRTVLQEDWSVDMQEQMADLIDAYLFEVSNLEQLSRRRSLEQAYFDMYLNLRVERNRALLLAAVELF